MLIPNDSPADSAPRRRRVGEMDDLRHRSELLSDKDWALMQMIFDNGGTIQQVARLTGQSYSTVSRRFHGLLRRMRRQDAPSPRGGQPFDALDVRIAREYFLRGLPQGRVAQKLGVSDYRVKRTLRTMRSIAYRHDNTGSADGRRCRKFTGSLLKGLSHDHLIR